MPMRFVCVSKTSYCGIKQTLWSDKGAKMRQRCERIAVSTSSENDTWNRWHSNGITKNISTNLYVRETPRHPIFRHQSHWRDARERSMAPWIIHTSYVSVQLTYCKPLDTHTQSNDCFPFIARKSETAAVCNVHIFELRAQSISAHLRIWYLFLSSSWSTATMSQHNCKPDGCAARRRVDWSKPRLMACLLRY